MSSRPRALVVGESVGGLFLAHLLRSIGWHVEVHGRSAGNLASRAAGIGGPEARFDVILPIGIPLDASVGISVRSRLCLDRGGDVVAEVPAGDVTAWARIYRALKDALSAKCDHLNLAVKRVDQDAHAVITEFTDGSFALIEKDGPVTPTLREMAANELACDDGRPQPLAALVELAIRPPGPLVRAPTAGSSGPVLWRS